MQIPLEKIDELRRRAGIGYLEAKTVLEEAEGDLVEALIYIEEGAGKSAHRFSSWGHEISQRLRSVASELHRTRLRVKIRENTLMDLPATYGALGVALFPKIAALGLAGMLFSKGSIEVGGRNGGAAARGEWFYQENLDKKASPGLGSDQPNKSGRNDGKE